jgi:hypothetical protein
MEVEGRGAAPTRAGGRAGPYAAAGELRPAALESPDPTPPPAFPRWVRPLADFERRETTTTEGSRFG